jgi:aryl-alcohol dehydrogenase-like predicted oxidoreductase
MKYLRFAPLGRDLSRLVLGTAVFEHAPLDVSLDLLDAFRDLGGNVVDTGREYGNAEPIVGRCWRARPDRRDRRPHQGRAP